MRRRAPYLTARDLPQRFLAAVKELVRANGLVWVDEAVG